MVEVKQVQQIADGESLVRRHLFRGDTWRGGSVVSDGASGGEIGYLRRLVVLNPTLTLLGAVLVVWMVIRLVVARVLQPITAPCVRFTERPSQYTLKTKTQNLNYNWIPDRWGQLVTD